MNRCLARRLTAMLMLLLHYGPLTACYLLVQCKKQLELLTDTNVTSLKI